MVFHSTSFRRQKRAAITMMFQSSSNDSNSSSSSNSGISTTMKRTSSSELFTMNACDVVSVRIRRRRRACNLQSPNPDASSSLSTAAPSLASKSRIAKTTALSSSSPRPLVLLFLSIAVFFFAMKIAPVHSLSAAKNEWMNNSLRYYRQITRKGAPGSSVDATAVSSSSALQQQQQQEQQHQQSPTYLKSAMENYFAREKIKDNKPQHAESIYRKLLKDFSPKVIEEECEFCHLAVPSLLLALLLQREGRIDDARVVFDGFNQVLEQSILQSSSSRKVISCSCSARVLQANALFEMKQSNPIKAAELIIRAVRMDRTLRPVLRWKQFREALIDYSTVQRLQREETKKQQQQATLGLVPAS